MVIYEVNSSVLSAETRYYKSKSTALRRVTSFLNKWPNNSVRITKITGQNEQFIKRTKIVR